MVDPNKSKIDLQEEQWINDKRNMLVFNMKGKVFRVFPDSAYNVRLHDINGPNYFISSNIEFYKMLNDGLLTEFDARRGFTVPNMPVNSRVKAAKSVEDAISVKGKYATPTATVKGKYARPAQPQSTTTPPPTSPEPAPASPLGSVRGKYTNKQ